jgi:MazG-like family
LPFLHERKGGRLGEEIADVLLFGLLFCHEAGLDPGKAIRQKLRTNARKYPVRLARGRALKYTELQLAQARDCERTGAKESRKRS